MDLEDWSDPQVAKQIQVIATVAWALVGNIAYGRLCDMGQCAWALEQGLGKCRNCLLLSDPGQLIFKSPIIISHYREFK